MPYCINRIMWYTRGRQVLVGYIGKNMPGKIFVYEILCTYHRKGKDWHGIQNEVTGIIYLIVTCGTTHAVCIRWWLVNSKLCVFWRMSLAIILHFHYILGKWPHDDHMPCKYSMVTASFILSSLTCSWPG